MCSLRVSHRPTELRIRRLRASERGNRQRGANSRDQEFVALFFRPYTISRRLWRASKCDSLVSWIAVYVSFPLLSCGGGGAGAGTPPQPSVSVSVSPSAVTLTPSHTQQFTARVTGTSNTAITWSVNGILGGN